MSIWKLLASISLFSACLWAQGPIEVHGYIQGRFTNQEGTPDRLEIRRARISASGKAFSKLSYVVQVDAAKRPYLMDLAVAWEFNRALKFTAGQFKIPFSAESLVSDNLNIPIARARAVNGFAPGRDTGVQARDLGAQLSGILGRQKAPFMEYATGVFRGQTLIEAPNVHYSATAGRAMIHAVKGLTMGGDWYASFSAPPKAQKRREEVEGGYERGRLRFRAEQIFAQDGTLDRRGGYFLSAWKLSRYWEPLARADWLTTDVHKANTSSTAYLAGLNFYWGKHVKIGANAGAQHDQGPKGTSSLFLAQTMLGF